jgi:uncharacterized protein (TIGR03067 family)
MHYTKRATGLQGSGGAKTKSSSSDGFRHRQWGSSPVTMPGGTPSWSNTMRTRILFIAAFTMFILLVPARAADDDAIQKELKKLEGTWQVISWERDGEKYSGKEGQKMIIKGNEFTLLDGDNVSEGTFKIIEVKGKSRKTDLTFTKGGLKDEKTCNIAEWIDEDTFRTCVGGEKERPTEFTSKGNLGIYVFKRVKK